MGQHALALDTLEGAEAPRRRHALIGGVTGLGLLTACVAQQWPQVGALWSVCVPAALAQGHLAFQASRDAIAAYRFQILVESGQRDRAVALARSRGWSARGPRLLRDRRAARVARDGHPARHAAAARPRDCALAVGAAIGDDGLVRLGRLMLRDRVERTGRAEVREQATWLLKYGCRPRTRQARRVAQRRRLAAAAPLQEPGRGAGRLPEGDSPATRRSRGPYHNIGPHLHRPERPEQARVWLLKALEVNPNHWRAQFSLAFATHRLERYDEALAAYMPPRAGMKPNDADTHANLGWVLLKLGRRTEAIASCRPRSSSIPRSTPSAATWPAPSATTRGSPRRPSACDDPRRPRRPSWPSPCSA